MWNRFDYSRKLVGSTLIFLAIVNLLKEQFSWLVILGGFLFFEHYFVWDKWDFYDYLIGHEWWGLYLISVGFLIVGNFGSFVFGILGFVIEARYKKFNTFKTFIPTIKEFFNHKINWRIK